MKTKSIIGGIVSGMLFFCICTVSVLGSTSIDKKPNENQSYERVNMKQIGELALEKAESNTYQSRMNEISIYAKGNHIEITEEEMNWQVKEKKLVEKSDNAEADALRALSKRKVLYYKATQQGYSLSEEELQALLDELKNSLKEAENESDIKDFVQAFGSIDDYLDRAKGEYKEGFIINEYLIGCQKKFAEENEITLDDEGFNQLWLNYYNQIVDQFIAEENIVVQ